MATITVKTDGTITIDPAGMSESPYLIDSNRKKCTDIFSKKEWRHGELIDGYIALHIVLEASLNSLYRQLAIRSLTKEVSPLEVMKNIDKISFIDKTTLFIYNSKFNFNGKLTEATKYHAVIGKIRSFCEIRNQLLHGHAVATVTDSQNNRRDTDARKNLKSSKRLAQQLNDFRFIVEGIAFYIDCLEGLGKHEQERYKKDFLAVDFLPNDIA